ncbi:MAG: epoxyqueuosine reductase [Bacteroidales bacterium]|nr:epoxyqueuosine reductase [Bacteroidales bacterium]
MRPEQDIISRLLHDHLQPAEDFIWGFADLNGLIDKKFGDFTYGISIGKRLDPMIVHQISQGPTLEYYSHYREMNDELSRISLRISARLKKSGIPTLNISPSVTSEALDTIYHETLRTEISHKMVATRAGLGWIGKTALFISHKFGPRLRLVTILTSYPLPLTKKPIVTSLCGNCALCVDACPANAATGQLWDTTVDRDHFFDAPKCRSQCAEFGKRFNQDIRICGICVAVCPAGENYLRR